MKPQIIQQGAEAIITLQGNQITKQRIPKTYRLKELDDKLRKSRTKKEAKILEKLQLIIHVPKIIETDNKETIIMEYLDGKKLSEHLESLDYKTICKQIGKTLTKLHNQDIVHGDLTTSNMILKDNQLYLIDFGLSIHSHKIEDKAVDLHLLKQALDAKHFKIAQESFKLITQEYKAQNHQETIQRIQTIESRGRYKQKH